MGFVRCLDIGVVMRASARLTSAETSRFEVPTCILDTDVMRCDMMAAFRAFEARLRAPINAHNKPAFSY